MHSSFINCFISNSSHNQTLMYKLKCNMHFLILTSHMPFTEVWQDQEIKKPFKCLQPRPKTCRLKMLKRGEHDSRKRDEKKKNKLNSLHLVCLPYLKLSMLHQEVSYLFSFSSTEWNSNICRATASSFLLVMNWRRGCFWGLWVKVPLWKFSLGSRHWSGELYPPKQSLNWALKLKT